VKKTDINTDNLLTATITDEQQTVSEEEKLQTTFIEQIVSIFKTINKALTIVQQ